MRRDHDAWAIEARRDGIGTRMRVSTLSAARQLCIFEQWCDPGRGVPTHRHAVEEVLEVVEGPAEVFLGGESAEVGPYQSVLVPAGFRHGFENGGRGTLLVRATSSCARRSPRRSSWP